MRRGRCLANNILRDAAHDDADRFRYDELRSQRICRVPSLVSISFFEMVWIAGMAAMMFPAMIPIVLFYNKIATKHESNTSLPKSVGTPLFLGGYLIVYAVLGICGYAAVYEAVNLSSHITQLAYVSLLASSSILITTGIYQFTPLKSRCLRNCISPIGFFASHYKEGLLGSLRMGISHGYFCIGCCWAFMLMMLAVGAMSIPVMAVLAGVIAVEKVIVRGAVLFKSLIGGSFMALGVTALIFPHILTFI